MRNLLSAKNGRIIGIRRAIMATKIYAEKHSTAIYNNTQQQYNKNQVNISIRFNYKTAFDVRNISFC